jgi:predicted MFS family arabinose efflux permease
VIALANGVGPFLGGAIASTSTWRWVFWIIPIVTVPTGAVIWFFLPLKHRSGSYDEKIRKIDYGGVLLNIASTLLVLVPLSGAGVTYAWRSPFVISSLTIGISLAALFVLYEWKIAQLPIMPLRLYKSRQCSALYMQSFLTGIAYFGNFFYLPIYFQSILKYSALTSGALILPLIISTSATSIIAGQSMSRIGRYMPCILVGFALWTIGAGLTLLFNRATSIGDITGYLIVEGAGIGLTLQPTLVGMYANSRSEDRAVITGLRNFIRTIGGAFGLVISGVVLSNTLNRELAGASFITGDVITELTSSTLAIDKMGFSPQENDKILAAYMRGIHYIFIFYNLCSGLSLLLTLLVGNTSLRSPQPPSQETNNKGRDQDLASPDTNIEISDKAAGCEVGNVEADSQPASDSGCRSN